MGTWWFIDDGFGESDDESYCLGGVKGWGMRVRPLDASSLCIFSCFFKS
jgi:hypothetical protein